MRRVLCLFGLHDMLPWVRHDLAAKPLMPSWFVCRKTCLRCGHEESDWDHAVLWDRGWRP